jgi:hypothetical protein
MPKIVACVGIGLAVVMSVTAGAAAKPGPTQVRARPGALVWDSSALKPGVPGAPAAGAVAGKTPEATPPALTGYTLVFASFTNPNGAQTFGSVACPPGTVGFGGGVVGGSSSVRQSINGSLPSVAGGVATGWSGFMDNTSGQTATMVVWGVCAKKPKQYAIVSAGFTNPAGSQTSGTVQCPLNARGKRMKVLGGGGVGGATSPGQDLNTSIPIGGGTRSWRVDVNNSFAIDHSATVIAVCGAAKKWMVITGAGVTNPAGVQTQADANCPAGRVDIGGGVFSNSGSTLVNINSTFPFSSSLWRSFENNAMGAADTITPYAVCVV